MVMVVESVSEPTFAFTVSVPGDKAVSVLTFPLVLTVASVESLTEKAGKGTVSPRLSTTLRSICSPTTTERFCGDKEIELRCALQSVKQRKGTTKGSPLLRWPPTITVTTPP